MLQIPASVLEQVRLSKPDLYYRIVSRIAQRISDRLRAASEMLAGQAAAAPQFTTYRSEHDSLVMELPNNAYYGVQTRERRRTSLSPCAAAELFALREGAGLRRRRPPKPIWNSSASTSDSPAPSFRRAMRSLTGELHDQFVVDMFQGGAGTSTRMPTR